MKKLIKENSGMIGSYVIRQYEAGTKNLLWGSSVIENKIVSSSGYGRNLLLRQMSGDTTYPIEIDSGKIGTSSTAPADAQTDLIAPVAATIDIVDFELTNNVLVVNIFIADAGLPNGTYTEFGLFMDGRMFSRSLISPSYVKISNRDTSIEYTITFT